MPMYHFCKGALFAGTVALSSATKAQLPAGTAVQLPAEHDISDLQVMI